MDKRDFLKQIGCLGNSIVPQMRESLVGQKGWLITFGSINYGVVVRHELLNEPIGWIKMLEIDRFTIDRFAYEGIDIGFTTDRRVAIEKAESMIDSMESTVSYLQDQLKEMKEESET